jgi:hypothetical protein
MRWSGNSGNPADRPGPDFAGHRRRPIITDMANGTAGPTRAGITAKARTDNVTGDNRFQATWVLRVLRVLAGVPGYSCAPEMHFFPKKKS